MIRKIAVGLDQSDLSLKALQQAILFAKSCGAELKLVHVLVDTEPGAPQFSGYFGGPLYPSINTTVIESYQTAWNQFVDRSQALLDAKVADVRQLGIKVSGSLLYGRPGPKLCDLAQTWNADLLIVGSRGMSGISQLLMGSVSNHVLHHAPCSVLIVHGPGASGSLSKPMARDSTEQSDHRPQRILVPVDRSELSKNAMETAIALAKLYQADIRLIHIIDGDEPGMPPNLIFSDSQYVLQQSDLLFSQYKQEWNRFINGWWQWLQQCVDEIEAEGPAAICDVMQGRTGPQICEVAQDWSADLIVMGCRGLSGLKELVVGSVSYYVSHRAPCSVFVARPQPSRQQDSATAEASRPMALADS